MKRSLVAGLVLLGLAGSGLAARQAAVAKPAAQAKPPAPTAAGQVPPAPAFDGDVAALAWGGGIESITGAKRFDAARGLLTDGGSYRTEGGKGPLEIVVSFFKREPALIRAVRLQSPRSGLGMRDAEVWVTSAAAPGGFLKVAQGSAAYAPDAFKQAELVLEFEPVEARFVQVRLLNNQRVPPAVGSPYDIRINRIQVFEAQKAGYTPLATRHPEIAEPVFLAEGAKAASAGRAPIAGCAPDADPALAPGEGESRAVMLLMSNYLGGPGSFVPLGIETGRFPKAHASKWEELKIFDRVKTTLVATQHLQPWMLADVDTVVMQQACDLKPLSPRVRRMLIAWVAAGHKLIIHDSDKCGEHAGLLLAPVPLQDRTTPAPSASRARCCASSRTTGWRTPARTRPGFVDTAAWVSWPPPAQRAGRLERDHGVGPRLVRPHGREERERRSSASCRRTRTTAAA